VEKPLRLLSPRNISFLPSFIAVFLIVMPAYGAHVTVGWDHNAEPNLDHYVVYWGTSPGIYSDNSEDIPNDTTSYKITGLAASETNYFAVTAVDDQGNESGYSNEVSYTGSALILTNLTIRGADSVVENSSSGYTATASFSNGRTQTVTAVAVWTTNSPYATIDSNGVLSTTEVSSDQTVTVAASFTHSGVTESATEVVTIVDVPESNRPPLTPVIVHPYDRQTAVEVPLNIATEPFSDPDGDPHGQSRWQISEQSFFPTLVLDVTSQDHLTVLPVPHALLKSNQTYYVRVMFYDRYFEASAWSEIVEFTTNLIFDDLNSNGIPDAWEVDNTVDLNLDGIPDNYQSEIIKCVRASVGSAMIGVEKVADSISEFEVLEVIDPATISDTVNRPTDLIFGLISYRLRVTQPGATATVRIYFSGGTLTSDTFFKYDTITGWYDYSDYTTFNGDEQSLNVELIDGGYGDSDGVANGIIVDPGGIASGGTSASGAGGGGGGGCFIGTAARKD